jgi:hypothetical protein
MPRHPSPSEYVLNVDYDHTLFNTSDFATDVLEMLARESGQAADAIAAAMPAFAAHADACGIEPGKAWANLEEILKATNYLYKDSAPFMQEVIGLGFNPRALTFGIRNFQEPKIISQLKQLVGDYRLAYDIIGEPKREFIAGMYAGRRGALVDDVSGQDLPSGFTEITIDRNCRLLGPKATSAGFVISGLAQALEVLRAAI